MSGDALRAALSHLGVDSAATSHSGWATVECPACPSGSTPSLKVNVQTGGYKCHRCGATSSGGPSLTEFVENPKAPGLGVQSSLSTRDAHPPLTEDLVARYHRILMDSPSVRKDLSSKRAWTDETMARLHIGYDGTHFWIPIRNIQGVLVNARLYDPFKRSTVKSFHYTNPDGTKRTVLWVPFGVQSLEGHKRVWLYEGEPDAILAAQDGFPTACITGGAGTFNGVEHDLAAIMEGREGTDGFKNVLCYDMDVAGRRGAGSVKSRMEAMDLPTLDLKLALSPGLKDYSDARLRDNRDIGWFKQLAAEQAKGQAGSASGAPPPIPVRLGEGVPGEGIVVKGHVLGTHNVPILIPSMFEARCRGDWNENCPRCPVHRANLHLRTEVQPDSVDMQLLVSEPSKKYEAEYKRIAGIPQRCPLVRFEKGSNWQVQHLKLVPPMSDRQGGDSTVRSAMYVSPADGRPMAIKPNQLYLFHGKIAPDVNTNEWTLVSAEARPAEDDVESFVMNAELADELIREFSPLEWTMEAVQAVIDQEAKSMARHVTRIYGREELLEAVDLTYHSVLTFPFKDRVLARGWMSIGILGDTRVGKSETISAFSAHIGLGKYVADPANTTYAGLVGGLQQVGKNDKAWTITWGLIPTNDRGLVAIDEASSLSTDDIGRMSGMRSSGVAELTKIRSASTPARTRLIMAGNPRGLNRTLSSFGTPVEGFMELIGAPEDVARFDMVVGVKSGLDKDAADEKLGPQPQPAPMELRRALVKFAWSRTSDQVRWDPKAEELASKLGSAMSKDYDNTIPIVEPSEQDVRIARLAVAAAVRTFSTMPTDRDVVLVKECHVKYAESLMHRAYAGDLGYADFSEFRARQKLDPEMAAKILTNAVTDVAAACRALLSVRRVHATSISMAVNLDRESCQAFISQLLQCGAARFDDDNRGSSMVWTTGFMEMLRRFEKNPPKQEGMGLLDAF